MEDFEVSLLVHYTISLHQSSIKQKILFIQRRKKFQPDQQMEVVVLVDEHYSTILSTKVEHLHYSMNTFQTTMETKQTNHSNEEQMTREITS